MNRISLDNFRRLLTVTLAAAALLTLAGCEEMPIVGDDIRVVHYSPGYLRAAYVFVGKDAASDAAESFRIRDFRLYGATGFGTYYPGCEPGLGEKFARVHGTILLPKTAGGGTGIDAEEYYRNRALIYAANYNTEMVRLVGVPAEIAAKVVTTTHHRSN